MQSQTEKGHRPKCGQKRRGCGSMNVAREKQADSFHSRQTRREAECEYSKSQDAAEKAHGRIKVQMVATRKQSCAPSNLRGRKPIT